MREGPPIYAYQFSSEQLLNVFLVLAFSLLLIAWAACSRALLNSRKRALAFEAAEHDKHA
jgi:hypothetical protein